MLRLHVQQIEAATPPRTPVEIVERKGRGHPDSICDALAEEISLALSRVYREAFGIILHHNVDKVLLRGGAAPCRALAAFQNFHVKSAPRVSHRCLVTPGDIAKAGAAVTFKVRDRDGLLGTIEIGQGTFGWKSGRGKKGFKRIAWSKLVDILDDI